MLCLVRSGEQHLTDLASSCKYRRPETSFLDGNRSRSGSTTSMDNGQALSYRCGPVSHCRCKKIPDPSELGRTPDTTLSACHRQIGEVCDSRATNAAFPNRAVGDADRHCVGDKDTAQAPQVRLEKNWRTMGSDPTLRSTQAHTRKTQGLMPKLCSGCLK